MKYISLVITIVLMAWTWSLATSSSEYGTRESREMETDIEAAITEFVASQRPSLQDIRFHQLFTEVVRPNQEIRAHLKYTVVDSTSGGETVEQSFQGTLTLIKSPQAQTWRSAAINIQSPLVEFRDGAKISVGEDGAPQDNPSQEGAPTQVSPSPTPTPTPQERDENP